VSAPRAEPGSTLTALAAAVLSTFSLGAPAARSANPSLSATPSLLKSAATSEGADAVGGANAGLTVAAATKRNESTTRAVRRIITTPRRRRPHRRHPNKTNILPEDHSPVKRSERRAR
jgi:hypothetical protein